VRQRLVINTPFVTAVIPTSRCDILLSPRFARSVCQRIRRALGARHGISLTDAINGVIYRETTTHRVNNVARDEDELVVTRGRGRFAHSRKISGNSSVLAPVIYISFNEDRFAPREREKGRERESDVCDPHSYLPAQSRRCDSTIPRGKLIIRANKGGPRAVARFNARCAEPGWPKDFRLVATNRTRVQPKELSKPDKRRQHARS
jgi:hypothetical protein